MNHFNFPSNWTSDELLKWSDLLNVVGDEDDVDAADAELVDDEEDVDDDGGRARAAAHRGWPGRQRLGHGLGVRQQRHAQSLARVVLRAHLRQKNTSCNQGKALS